MIEKNGCIRKLDTVVILSYAKFRNAEGSERRCQVNFRKVLQGSIQYFMHVSVFENFPAIAKYRGKDCAFIVAHRP